jgi:hypothetical protein
MYKYRLQYAFNKIRSVPSRKVSTRISKKGVLNRKVLLKIVIKHTQQRILSQSFNKFKPIIRLDIIKLQAIVKVLKIVLQRNAVYFRMSNVMNLWNVECRNSAIDKVAEYIELKSASISKHKNNYMHTCLLMKVHSYFLNWKIKSNFSKKLCALSRMLANKKQKRKLYREPLPLYTLFSLLSNHISSQKSYGLKKMRSQKQSQKQTACKRIALIMRMNNMDHAKYAFHTILGDRVKAFWRIKLRTLEKKKAAAYTFNLLVESAKKWSFRKIRAYSSDISINQLQLKAKFMIAMRTKRGAIVNEARDLWKKWLMETKDLILKEKVKTELNGIGVIDKMILENSVSKLCSTALPIT